MELDGDWNGEFADVLQDVENTRGRNKVAVELKKLRNDAFSDVYCSRNIFIILLLHPDDGGTTVLRNVCICWPVDVA
jgi:hypothetical protein